jgi:hypothetical protein
MEGLESLEFGFFAKDIFMDLQGVISPSDYQFYQFLLSLFVHLKSLMQNIQ